MKALVAFNGEVIPPDWEEAFERHGISLTWTPYSNINEIEGDLKQTGIVPSDFVFHDGGADFRALEGKTSPVVMPMTAAFNGAARDGRAHPDAVIRQAFLSLSCALPHGDQGVVTAGDYAVDLITGQAWVAGHEIKLKGRQFQVFRALCVHANERCVTLEGLAERGFGTGSDVDEPSVSIRKHISRLNQKIVSEAGERFKINPIGNSGYHLGSAVQDYTAIGKTGITLSPSSSTLKYNGKELRIEPKQAEILEKLAHGFVPRDTSGSKALKVHINHLRDAMVTLTGEHHFIETVLGKGYRLSDTPMLLPGRGRWSTPRPTA